MTDSIAEHYAYLLRAHEYALGMAPRKRRLELIAKLIGTKPPEAFAIVAALKETRGLRGDVCEIGVAQGATSALIANEIMNSTATLHLFDSFEGLPAPTAKDVLLNDVFNLGSMTAYAGKMACPLDMVLERLADVGLPPERYRTHVGFIEKTLAESNDLPTHVRVAYLDVDLYEPTKVALEWLASTMEPGSVVIVDDYGFFSSGVAEAIREVSAGWNVEVCHPSLGHFCTLRRV
jgi:predicted O-methyltransferase YrrM